MNRDQSTSSSHSVKMVIKPDPIVKPPKPAKRYWAGICNDKIHTTVEADTGRKIMAIFPNKKCGYECVRQVRIIEVGK